MDTHIDSHSVETMYKLMNELNWPHLRPEEAKVNGTTVVWFASESDHGVKFQVNTMPVWAAGVYAFRFRIITGFHAVHIGVTDTELARELWRLKDWLHADLFLTIDGRRRFRKLHPECSGYTQKAYAERGLPYRALYWLVEKGGKSEFCI